MFILSFKRLGEVLGCLPNWYTQKPGTYASELDVLPLLFKHAFYYSFS